LNNDVVVAADWVERLLEVMVEEPQVGSCTSKVLDQADHRIVDNCGHVLYADGLTRGRGRLEADDGRFDQIEEVFCSSGCACLLRRAMLDDVGLFDEAFFAYCEDADLGFRGRLRGWRCLYVPAAVAYHEFSGSSATAYSALKALNVERNRLWLAVKNLPLPLLAMSVPATLTRYGWQAFGALSRRGASGAFVRDRSAVELVRILLASYRQGFAGLPRAWRQRRQIQERRTASTLEVLGWLRRFGIGARHIALLD
jgi:GT2 family glycosyltransferase